jgi:hypothetical protein
VATIAGIFIKEMVSDLDFVATVISRAPVFVDVIFFG